MVGDGLGVVKSDERGKTKHCPQRADHEATWTALGPPVCSGFLLLPELQVESRGESAWRKGELTL